MVRISVGSSTHQVSERLYGVFFEDINHSADGGLNANMVNNYSFDGVYLDTASDSAPASAPRVSSGSIIVTTEGWYRFVTKVSGKTTNYGKLRITVESSSNTDDHTVVIVRDEDRTI